MEMEIDLLSLFPDYFRGPFQESILKRAQEKGLVALRHVDLRAFGIGSHRKVDDRVYGGGPGMVLMAPVVKEALTTVRRPHSHVVYLTPQGARLTQATCQRLASYKHLILLAGHYEGIDERALEEGVDEEISIGDYVLTNGALSALVLVDAIVRLIPGVLGDSCSARQDSFVNGLLDCPHYTRPEEFEGRRVPHELLSGDHAKIAAWRLEQALERTQKRRLDLYLNYVAQQGRAGEVISEEGEGDLVCSIFAEHPQKAAHFYKKSLGMTVIESTRECVRFKEGFTLAQREKKAYPVLFIYTVRTRGAFEHIYTRLVREHRIHDLQQQGERMQVSFIDELGYPWVLIYTAEESKHGKQSVGTSLRREL